MTSIVSFRDLVAWQKGMDLVVAVYRLSQSFPTEERFGLAAQVRRAVVSVPSNIAEGHGRRTRSDFVHFLDIARGSANETETQLLIAERLGFISPERNAPVLKLVDEVQRLQKALVNSLEDGPTRDVRGRA
jgi:four helix bundle protein